MHKLASRSARLLAVVPFFALLAISCGCIANGPSSPVQLAGRNAVPDTLSAPSLGAASNFVILGGPGVTMTRSAVIGDVGAGFAGAPVTQTLGSVTGTVNAGNVIAAQAYRDFRLAYSALGATPNSTDPTHKLAGTLAAVTLGQGVYNFDAAATLTGVLTLDAGGDPNATWIFKIGSGGAGALTATNFSVVMAGGGQADHVSWWVADAVTISTSNFQGNLLSGAAITFSGPGSFTGRAFATAAVTLTDMNPCKISVSSEPVSPTIDPVTPSRTF